MNLEKVSMTNNDEYWDGVEAVQEITLIPKGEYRLYLEKITEQTVKKTGDNFGKPLYSCQFNISDDQQHGRKIFMNFMPHSEIARSQVKALAMATNTALIGDMYRVLMGAVDKECIGTIVIRKDKTGDYQNTIRAFKPLPVVQPVFSASPVLPPGIEIFTGADGFSKWVKDANAAGGFRQVG